MLNFQLKSNFNTNKYQSIITEINNLENNYKLLSNSELRTKIFSLQQEYNHKQNLDDLIIRSFALTREASHRTLGLRHFDVQLLGGLVLNNNKIAEMKTGEGKTLVASLPATLNAITKKGVHIVTVNNYLANRDQVSMGQIYRFLGFDTGLIIEGMTAMQKKENYNADITYVTNYELTFDFLRDNIAVNMSDVVLRPFNYCIIDEVDSILIDEAQTPLILSDNSPETSVEKYIIASEITNYLELNQHYEVDEKNKNIILTEQGTAQIEKIIQVQDLYNPKDPWIPYILNALKANCLFFDNVHYIIQNERIVIVDEFTGRIMPDRRWGEGLHQAIEAKEKLPIRPRSETQASITYQNFFLMYPKLSGMTGTGKTAEIEFEKIYNLPVNVIPTFKPTKRKDLPDLIYKDQFSKWNAIAKFCQTISLNSQPVLIGTTTVEKSEMLSQLLNEYNLAYEVLNARPENVRRESEIVAQAGRQGALTIATNMAGRGTDIILGGNADYMAKLKVREYLMPKIVMPEDNNSISIGLAKAPKNRAQGFGGGGKKAKTWQVSPQIFPTQLSKETEQQLKDTVAFAVQEYGEQSLPELEAEEKIAVAGENAPTKDPVIQKLRDVYQKIKGEYEQFTHKEQEEVIERGGLHVIGTERHESRRIDNQLRGRAGRQGDRGSTKFFLSLEDNLLRIFGGDRVAGLMNAFRVEEDMPIESKMLTRSLEGAQKKVETFYYDTRKQVFEYDEVMNNQRRAIYAERRRVLEGLDLKEQVLDYAEKTMDEIVEAYVNPELPPEEWELEKLVNKSKEFVYLLQDLEPEHLEDMTVGEIKTFLREEVRKAYDIKEHQVEQIQAGLMRQAERFFILQQIDTLWREHLQSMDALRESIGLRGYGQKDPLIEYKQEGYEMFLEMMIDIRRNVVYSLFQFQPQVPGQAA